jgi:hypothetical protein
MPPSSSEKRLALAGAVSQFSGDLNEIAVRINWALPTSSGYMTEQELASITTAGATIAQLRDDLAELAGWLEGGCLTPADMG